MVVWGSLSVAQALMRDRLVDEVHLWLCPILLGRGKRLFTDGLAPQRMRILGTKHHEGGAVSLRVARPDG
jgi:dihydrofolate reductase